jgi:hypothetical protein
LGPIPAMQKTDCRLRITAEAAEASKSATPSKTEQEAPVMQNKKRPAASEIVEGEQAPEPKAQCVDAC